MRQRALQSCCGRASPHTPLDRAAPRLLREPRTPRAHPREPPLLRLRGRGCVHRSLHGPARRLDRDARPAPHRRRPRADRGAVRWVSLAYMLVLAPHTRPRRAARRPLRAQAALHLRLRRLHARLGAVRAGAHARLADRRARVAGARGGDAAGQLGRADRREPARQAARPAASACRAPRRPSGSRSAPRSAGCCSRSAVGG